MIGWVLEHKNVCVSFEKKGLLIRCLIKCLNEIESLVLSVDCYFGYVVVAYIYWRIVLIVRDT